MTPSPYSGKPETKRRSRNPWPFRIALILFIWALIYFFFAGPGRLIFPGLLISYSSVTDQRNRVYYFGDRIEEALDLLWVASVTQDSIRRFSGDPVADGFNGGVVLFLCESPRQYFHLTWNNAKGSSVLGRIVLNAKRINGSMSTYSAVIHEMYHRYIIRKYGYLPSVLLYPKWFEEGCATLLQDYSTPADKLGENLLAQPCLVSVTSLRHPWNWQSMVRMEEGRMASRGYGQVCLFTRYLATRYGLHKLHEYMARLHWNPASERTFESVFGTPLETAESTWLKEMQEAGTVPASTRFIALPFDAVVFLRWMLILLMVLFPVFAAFRLITGKIPGKGLRKKS